MSRAIYRLNTNNPASLGIPDFPPAEFDARMIMDTRFFSFGKEPVEVQLDLFKFLAEQDRLIEESRVPDDLELMYTSEVKLMHGIQVDPNSRIGLTETLMGLKHSHLSRAYHDIKLEVVAVLADDVNDLIDEALEIYNDRLVTRALALASNPFAQVTKLMGLVEDVYRAAKACVKLMAAHSQEDAKEALQYALNQYLEMHQSMRFVTLAKDKEV